MLQDHELAQPLAESIGLTVGQRLARARERLHLSTEQVAQKLRLNHQWILLIEHDEYQHLPSSAYLKGYLRGYAKLLGLSADDIIAAYRLAVPEQQAPINRATMNLPFVAQTISKRQRRHGKRFMRYLSLMIAVVLIVLVVMWWRGQAQNKPNRAQNAAPFSLQQLSSVANANQPTNKPSFKLPEKKGVARG